MTNDYQCPWCERAVYPGQQPAPIVGQCRHRRKTIRLVGDRFRTWAEWLKIQAAALSLCGRQ